MFPLITKYRDATASPVWGRVASFSMILFFIFLSNAILSFWVPNLLQDIFGDPAKMGLIISFSSLVGFLADLTLPQILRGVSVRSLSAWAIIGMIIFSFILLIGIEVPLIFTFLIAMGVWGVYYEFILFSEQQFVSDSIPYKFHSSSWALLDIFKNLGYLVGPILAGYLILTGERNAAYGAIIFSVVAFLILLSTKKSHARPIEINLKQVNIVAEIEHWSILFKHVWPIVILSLFLGIVDAAFWTTGAVWTESLVKESFWGIFLLPAYQLPPLFMGFVIARWGIVEGKKKLALQYFLVSSAFVSLLGFTNIIPLQIVMVLLSSVMLSVTYPMLEAVYSNILQRMGRERQHLIGLSNSAGSLSYIIGPAICGFITSAVGESKTFSIIGVVGMVVALTLLAVTPKKIKLPQSEIQNWED